MAPNTNAAIPLNDENLDASELRASELLVGPMLRVVTEPAVASAFAFVAGVADDGGGSAEDAVVETDVSDEDLATGLESDNAVTPIDEFPAGRGIAPPIWIDEAEPLKSPYI